MYVVAGPTASGKTAVAVQLAKLTGSEVISADSMQVYTGMDIGTAKPTIVEMGGIPHHMLDITMPDKPISVAEYVKLATNVCKTCTPIVAGGTGFYINALIYGTQFSEIDAGQHLLDNELRDFYTNLAAQKGAAFLHEKLQIVDPAYAAIVHPNNIKKVARALSYHESTGQLFSAHNAMQKATASLQYDLTFVILSLPRDALYDRINGRVLAMWEAGLPDEVCGLLDAGYHTGLSSMQGIGYKETIPFLQGHSTKDETINCIQQATRNYAKRQDTWFRHQVKNAIHIDVFDKTAEQIAEQIMQTKETSQCSTNT